MSSFIEFDPATGEITRTLTSTAKPEPLPGLLIIEGEGDDGRHYVDVHDQSVKERPRLSVELPAVLTAGDALSISGVPEGTAAYFDGNEYSALGTELVINPVRQARGRLTLVPPFPWMPLDVPLEVKLSALGELQARRDKAFLPKEEFLDNCMMLNLLDPAEAKMASRGFIPPSFEPILATLPAYEADKAEITWGAVRNVSRMDPFVLAIAEKINLTPEQLDLLFGIDTSDLVMPEEPEEPDYG